ncbi:pilus assembly PilX family protein [Thiolinea disciformis]|uniref:pilus assembly PilX family protein n=1 Tax=Thiolinea disciformis TaxID=125614 RepID=UPI0003679421|nr:PilX N-terminal domain-containing pilus assembly protein [Thiolinea disciformis]
MYITQARQQGAALLWGMVLLLVLTVIGVAAARMGVTDTKIVGNEMSAMLTYQDAESLLNQMRPPLDQLAPEATLSYLKMTIEAEAHKKAFEANQTGAATSGQIIVNYGERLTQCNPQEGYAMRIEMTPEAGGYECNSFIITAKSHLVGSGNHSTHSMGVMHFSPARSQTLSSSK